MNVTRGFSSVSRMAAHLSVMSLFAFSFSPLGGAPLQKACAADLNHAGMVIRFSQAADSERSWCIQFAHESISGMEALRLTGLPVVTKTYGSEGEYVCKIGDVGTDAADCPAKDGSYWGYWRMTAQGWRHAGIGASSARVRCGSLEGWAWLQGGTGPAPSAAEFSSLCTSAGCRAAPSDISPPAESDAAREGSAGGGQTDGGPPSNTGLAGSGSQPPEVSSSAGEGALRGPDVPGLAVPAVTEKAGRRASAAPGIARNGAQPVDSTADSGPGSITATTASSRNGREARRTSVLEAKATGQRKAPWALYAALLAAIAGLAFVRILLFRRERPDR